MQKALVWKSIQNNICVSVTWLSLTKSHRFSSTSKCTAVLEETNITYYYVPEVNSKWSLKYWLREPHLSFEFEVSCLIQSYISGKKWKQFWPKILFGTAAEEAKPYITLYKQEERQHIINDV